MWWWVWVLLVVAALAGAAWLAWSLWRRGVRLLREAGAAGETLGSVADRAAREAARTEPPDTSPTIFDEPVELAARVEAVRRRGARLAADRRQRRERTWQLWGGGSSGVEEWLARRVHDKAARRGPAGHGGVTGTSRDGRSVAAGDRVG